MAVVDLPAPAEFAHTLGMSSCRPTTLLHGLLSRLSPDAALSAQLGALERLGRFVVAGPSVRTATPALARFEMLVVALERLPAARTRFTATIAAVMASTTAVKLLGEIGLPNSRGLWAETADRLAARLLPEAPRPHELWMLASHIVRDPADLAWLGPAADPLLQRLADISGAAWRPLRRSIHDALTLIAMRIASIGTSEPVRSRSEQHPSLRDSPLFLLGLAAPEDMPPLIEASRRCLVQISETLERTGVSVDLVYSLDAMERGLARIELLLPFASTGEWPPNAIRSVIAACGNSLIGLRSFRSLIADNTRLLARKVIERAGHSGEHYVTTTRGEYWRMLRSALGGGAVIVFLTVSKFFIHWGHLSPFLDAVLATVAYSAAFILMQMLGFTLATKQPSMTAAALAGAIRARSGPGQLDELVLVITRITRSQFVAIVGNVVAVITVAIVFDTVFAACTGESFLDAADATASARSLDPLASWTIAFAAITGVQLWMSSLCAGWFENWLVYRRIPEAIEHHRFGRRFGKPRMQRTARWIEHNASGIAGSIALGALFGFTPQIAGFFGIANEGRHITITTTSLVLSTTSLGLEGLGTTTFVWGVLGLVAIALCNFGVSFALALVVALRAREVPRGQRLRLPAAVLRRFVRHPLEFFFPPKS